MVLYIGSGKTYTVFGPDAIDAPEAWFKHNEPQPLWVSRLSLAQFFAIILLCYIILPSPTTSSHYLELLNHRLIYIFYS